MEGATAQFGDTYGRWEAGQASGWEVVWAGGNWTWQAWSNANVFKGTVRQGWRWVTRPTIAPPSMAAVRPGKAPEFSRGQVTESGFLNSAERYLGAGYQEVSPGRFVSADGRRQVRFGVHETRGPQMYAHFEALERGRVIENARVIIVPD